MRIAIYGAGGLGGYYGARLAAAGQDVAFIARGAHLDVIQREGLRLESPLGAVHLRDAEATDDPSTIGPVDLVIVAVKTWQIPDVARAMSPLLHETTSVIPFLNGVEAADELAAVIGPSHVLGGLSKIFSLIEAPGVIRHFTHSAYVEFGKLDGGPSARTARLAQVFERAGIETVVSADIRGALWRKLLMVGSWAGLGALARSPIGVLRAGRETRALIDHSIDEGIAVANAHGHAIEATYKDELWRFYESLPGDATASMQRDILAGKPSEIDAWNGAIVRFGAAAGVPTPMHGFTYSLLQPTEARARAKAGASGQ